MQIVTDGKAGEIIDEHKGLTHPIAVHITREFINNRLGFEMSIKAMARLLQNVEFEVKINGPNMVVTPPFWRTDIEIPEDMVEEVGRLYGYDNVPLELPKRAIQPAPRNPRMDLRQHLRTKLAAAGANEVLTYSFVHGNLLDRTGQDKTKAFQLANALSPDLQYYRLTMTPSLLDKVHMNIKAGTDEFAIFEFGNVHMKGMLDSDDKNVPQEDAHLALILAVDDKLATRKGKTAPYFQAKKYLEYLAPQLTKNTVPLADFDFGKGEWGRQLTKPYDPMRSAAIIKHGIIWGVVGEFLPAVRQKLKLPEYTAGFEIGLQALADMGTTYTQLSRFPKVTQDITLKVGVDMPYQQLYDFLEREIGKEKPQNCMCTLTPIDIYHNPKDTQHKHVTLRLSIASYDRTLTDQEVNTLLDEVSLKAKKQLGADRI